jgi:predicted metal-dependent hydrolase
VRHEGWHARSHVEVVEHLARHGIDVTPFTREIDDLFDRILADRPFGRTLPPWLQREWLGFRVAAIAGIEHYTCVLGAWALESRGLDAAGADPTMLDLIRWHAAEEVEHRTISYEASRHLGVGWVRRQIAFAFVVPLLWYVWAQGTRFLARRDPSPARPRPSWRAVIRAGRQDRLPTIASLVRATLRYVSPFYHPRREGSLPRATEYLARSPAAQAAAAAAA